MNERMSFYDDLDMIYGECQRKDIKIIVGGLNAKIGRENVYRQITGKYSLHTESNDNFASLQRIG
jgi:hypothetical protein